MACVWLVGLVCLCISDPWISQGCQTFRLHADPDILPQLCSLQCSWGRVKFNWSGAVCSSHTIYFSWWGSYLFHFTAFIYVIHILWDVLLLVSLVLCKSCKLGKLWKDGRQNCLRTASMNLSRTRHE